MQQFNVRCLIQYSCDMIIYVPHDCDTNDTGERAAAQLSCARRAHDLQIQEKIIRESHAKLSSWQIIKV